MLIQERFFTCLSNQVHQEALRSSLGEDHNNFKGYNIYLQFWTFKFTF